MEVWRRVLGIDRRAGWAPVVTIPVGVLGVVVNSVRDDGDLRVGILPWTLMITVVGLAVCCLGVLNAHRPTPNRWTTIGAWWTAAALLGIGGFFAAIGIGGILGIDEDEAGAAAIIPVLFMAFGMVSMAPALATLGVGVVKARRLAWWGRLAVWTAIPVLPLLLIYGGLVEGTAETVGSILLITAYGISWITLGLALARLSDDVVGQARVAAPS